ncbi:hypothetical protein FNO01nite_00230 [Flavobacterium noncentrifugens]|uniref:Uncharacterized protein n=1 Tax=Flavobacterium noncentrifugens TaxID=1128970 RepID=A0A1G8R9X7_9FLAO|nr:hypothetical protein [Flavobacterium noncentrifugens]GEP49351.1 hypothetical protein FNO01nite_00230 [Flavobacterium noncentrifugens]SDJ13766.1 hypothetical protein SAMN04487935_0031 [Flavobacterium noncentrifugens]
MKTLFKSILFIAVWASFISCEEGEVFTGEPDASKVEFVTLQGQIATTETAVVASQRFPVTITIPQSFPVDVSVEATSFLPNINRRARKTFLIKAGQTVLNDFMVTPGAEGAQTFLPFNSNIQVYLSAITSSGDAEIPGFAGKQYALTSNVLNLDFGETPLGGINPIRSVIRFDWENPNVGSSSYNNLNIRLKRADGTVVTVSANSNAANFIYGTTTQTARYETLNFLNGAEDGVYIVEVWAARLISDPVNLPYRFAIRFPDQTSKVISGVIPNLSLGTVATAFPLLQITKSTPAGSTASTYQFASL